MENSEAMIRAFDNEKYLEEQASYISDRAKKTQKLYLEFGGKLLWDWHAARVLPGYDPNVKIRLLSRLKDKAEVILCIFAGDIERKRIRGDFGITYDASALQIFDQLGEWGVSVAGVVITRYEDQPAADQFGALLERRNVKVFRHRPTKGYPSDVDTIVSPEGYGSNAYIPTTKPIVVITGPGPGSGKLATALSLLYNDHMAGRRAWYAKFETFPVWNLPLKHPVNIAYEAATVDLADFNCVDPFHLEATGEMSINYNRDVEVFPVLKRILERISDRANSYRSPTEMGVNRIASGIIDNDKTRQAAMQEIIRRYFRHACEYAMGVVEKPVLSRIQAIMDELELKPEDRIVVQEARNEATRALEQGKGNQGVCVGAALELPDGSLISGKNSPFLHAASAVVLNATKKLAHIPERIHLLPPVVTASIATLKRDILGRSSMSLSLDETLIALSVSAAMNPTAQAAMESLTLLAGCELHLTHIPSPGDEAGMRRLGLNATSDPFFAGNNLFLS
jgi:uncharacterized protein (UPF0371 family)